MVRKYQVFTRFFLYLLKRSDLSRSCAFPSSSSACQDIHSAIMTDTGCKKGCIAVFSQAEAFLRDPFFRTCMAFIGTSFLDNEGIHGNSRMSSLQWTKFEASFIVTSLVFPATCPEEDPTWNFQLDFWQVDEWFSDGPMGRSCWTVGPMFLSRSSIYVPLVVGFPKPIASSHSSGVEFGLSCKDDRPHQAIH